MEIIVWFLVEFIEVNHKENTEQQKQYLSYSFVFFETESQLRVCKRLFLNLCCEETTFFYANRKICGRRGLTDLVSFPYLVVDGDFLTKYGTDPWWNIELIKMLHSLGDKQQHWA